jgi:arylsulfatase A-like enzyme
MGPSASGLEDLDYEDEQGFGRFPELRLIRRHRQSDPTFAAMIEALDASIGRFLATLTDEGLEDETLVAFTSDNGGVSSAWHFVPPGCNAPLREGKGWTCEGGIRVPFALRWPGRIAPSAEVEVPVIGMDLVPTLLAAAGIAASSEHHPDGIDLLPLVGAGVDAMPERDLFWHYPHYQGHGGRPACAIRSGDWKLLRWFEGPTHELFDLRSDPGESKDLAAQRPDVVEELGARLDAWLRDVGAQTPEPNPRWPRHGAARSRVQRSAARALARLTLWRWDRRTGRRSSGRAGHAERSARGS